MGTRRNTGFFGRHGPALWLSGSLARRLMALTTILGVLTLMGGASLLLAQRASASPLYDVCASGCTFPTIQDAIDNTGGSPNPVTPLATINVAPGVYNELLTINRAVTIIGAGVGQSIINPTSGAAAAGSIAIGTPSSPGNVTISGFTIEGATASSQAMEMSITDTNASDTITISGNEFYNDATVDPNNLTDGADALYVTGTAATTKVTNNTFQGLFQAVLVEANPGPFSFLNNDVTQMVGFDYGGTTPPTFYAAEGVLFLSDVDTSISAPTIVSGNIFENYGGLGIGVDAGYPCEFGYPCLTPLYGAYSNMQFTSNTFNLQGINQGGTTNLDSAGISLHANGLTNTVTSTISNVTISDNTFNVSSSTSRGTAITLDGDITSGVGIDHNTMTGSGAAPPLAGINFDAPDSGISVALTSNIIRGFVIGANADSLPAGATVGGSQNCISGNMSSGFTSSGATVNAQNNWWGSPLGPGTGVGYGNPVSANVATTPFLVTAPQAECAGPVASNIQSSVTPLPINTNFTLSDILSTTATSGAPIHMGYYILDGGAPQTMTASSGPYGSSNTLTVSSPITGYSSPGTHTLCVFGADTLGQYGDFSPAQTSGPNCITLTVVVPTVNTTTTVTSSLNPSVAGQSVTFTITVVSGSGTPSGTVDLKDGATTIASGLTLNGSGVATYTTSALAVGTHPMTADYAGATTGSAIYQPSTSAPLSQVVNAVSSPPSGSSNAYIRIAQSSEYYPTSDITIDGKVVFTNIASCTVQTYFPISAGNHTFTVLSPSGGSSVISATENFTAGSYYTLAVVGNTSPAVTPAMVVFTDNNTISPNQATARVYNLSDTLGAVQVKAGATVMSASLAYQSATSYTTLSPGAVAFTAQPTSGPTITDNVTVAANQVYSVFLMCNTKAVNAAAAGIPSGLPQTGYDPHLTALSMWSVALMVVGGLLLLTGGVGFGSYAVLARRRRSLS